MAGATTTSRRSQVAAALAATRVAFSSVALLSGVSNVLMLTGPLFMLQIYDRVLASRSVPTLIALSVLVFVLYLFLGILEVVRARLLARIGMSLEDRLGPSTFGAVLDLPLKLPKSYNLSQPLRDLDQIRQFMSGLGPVAICDLPWLPIYLAILFLFDPVLGWLATAGAAILVVLAVTSELAMRAPLGEVSGLQARRSRLAEAGRLNADVLRAMGMAANYGARWQEANDRYVAAQRGVSDTTGGFSAATKVFRLALQSAVLAAGAWLAIKQVITPGVMIAASILTSRALSPIEQAIGQWRGFLTARQSRSRLEALLEKLSDDKELLPLPAPEKMLVVSGLAVTAPGNTDPLVQNVAFRLSAGQGLGIIGPSGSGKSTLARALVGIWPPMRGAIRLDGAELDQWAPEALGPHVGYLPQDVALFDGTVAENISRFAADADPNTIIKAAQMAAVAEMILSLPDGYNTNVGTNGVALSAGQRQRIGLARALYGDPFLIVLDEPNANLDSDGEAALAKALSAARETGAIVVVITHRRNVLASVDTVLVLGNGRQVAFGPRDEVLQKTTIRPAVSA